MGSCMEVAGRGRGHVIVRQHLRRRKSTRADVLVLPALRVGPRRRLSGGHGLHAPAMGQRRFIPGRVGGPPPFGRRVGITASHFCPSAIATSCSKRFPDKSAGPSASRAAPVSEYATNREPLPPYSDAPRMRRHWRSRSTQAIGVTKLGLNPQTRATFSESSGRDRPWASKRSVVPHSHPDNRMIPWALPAARLVLNSRSDDDPVVGEVDVGNHKAVGNHDIAVHHLVEFIGDPAANGSACQSFHECGRRAGCGHRRVQRDRYYRSDGHWVNSHRGLPSCAVHLSDMGVPVGPDTPGPSGTHPHGFANAATVSASSALNPAGSSRIRKWPRPGSTRSW